MNRSGECLPETNLHAGKAALFMHDVFMKIVACRLQYPVPASGAFQPLCHCLTINWCWTGVFVTVDITWDPHACVASDSLKHKHAHQSEVVS